MRTERESRTARLPEVKFRDYWRVLLTRKWLILTGFLLVMGATFVYLHKATPVYQAETALMREQGTSPAMSLFSTSTTLTSTPSVEGQKRFIKSAFILGEVAKRMTASGFPVAPSQLIKHISLDAPGRGEEVLTIAATADNPAKAKVLADTAADVYISKTLEMKSTTFDQAEQFLQQQMEIVNGSLQQAEEALNTFREREGITVGSESKSEGSSGLLKPLGDLYAELSTTQMDEELMQAQLNTARQLLAEKRKEITPLASANQSTSQIEQLQSMIADWEIELVVLKQRYTDKDREVIDLKEKIAAAQSQLEEEVQKFVQQESTSIDPLSEWRSLIQQSVQLDIQLKGLQQKEKLLSAKITKFKSDHPQLISKQVELTRLERTARIYEQTYMLLMDKYEQTRLLKQMKTAGIMVIDRASEPKSPIKPKKYLTLVLGVMIGLLLGVGAAFFLEYIDDSLRIEKDIDRFLQLPVVGVIPKIEPQKIQQGSRKLELEAANPGMAEANERIITAKTARRKRRSKKYQRSLYELLGRAITNFEPKSPVTESYRTLNTNIKYANVDEEGGMKTILVSSPGPHEGKTLTVGNLAITMARMGAKTLLVDADLRRPRLHSMFQQKREPGLTELLAGEDDSRRRISELETLHSEEMPAELGTGIIRKTEVDNLYLLPCGARPPNPAELLSSDRMRQLIEELRAEYDVILFDSPPVVPVTDASILASEMADIVLLIVQSGETKRDIAMKAKEMLAQVDARIFGVVLNTIDYAKQYGSYYYYYYHYYYSHDEEE